MSCAILTPAGCDRRVPAQERILIYTQWLAHVHHVGGVLALAGLPALSMSGDLGHCMRCLSAFGGAEQPRILLLSSQYHASGINLQVARNLIFVHPYCTPSATYPEAVSFDAVTSYEQQAIGRIRRYPQEQTVRVYRLYAGDSVEEMLYRGGYSHGAPTPPGDEGYESRFDAAAVA